MKQVEVFIRGIVHQALLDRIPLGVSQFKLEVVREPRPYLVVVLGFQEDWKSSKEPLSFNLIPSMVQSSDIVAVGILVNRKEKGMLQIVLTSDAHDDHAEGKVTIRAKV